MPLPTPIILGMNHKVLLADDSLTIQKVIKITLANQPYEITEASNEDELFSKLPTINPELVFLDFNLSEKYTGYELTTKIKAACPSCKVLLLLGTFDTVDDAAMEKCGASDKIVKPFDSNKFIAICKKLIDMSSDLEELPFPTKEPASIKEDLFKDEDNGWQMGHSTARVIEEHKPEPAKSQFPVNALNKEISDWGMSVPAVIDEDSSDAHPDLPPVIGEVRSLDDHRHRGDVTKGDIKYPETDDLDYPTIEDLQAASPQKDKESIESKLLSIDAFTVPDTAPEMVVERAAAFVEVSDINSLQDQIRDEVEEDLWKVDEFEDLKKEVAQKIESFKSDFHPTRNDFDESLFKPLDDTDSITWNEPAPKLEESRPAASVDMASFRKEMESMVKRYVKEYMDQMFQKNVEKVSWEVIPDLAENLIRQELGKISSKIINDQK